MRSAESFALQLVRVLEEICLEDKALRELTVHMPSHIAFYLLSERRHEISQLEEKYTLSLDLREDDKLSTIGFRIEHKGRFILDGLGAHGKEDNKDASKDEGKKNKSAKKQRSPHRDHPHRDNKERGSDSEGKVAGPQDLKSPVQASESSVTTPGSHNTGEDNQQERRKRSRYRGRRRRPASGAEGQQGSQPGVQQEGQQQNAHSQGSKDSKGPAEGNSPAPQAAPAHQEVREKKPAHQYPRSKSEGKAQGSTQVPGAGNTGDKPAPKGNRKKGWWQRLLD